MNVISIREAGPGDLDGIARLYAGFYGELRLRQGLEPRSLEEYRGELREMFGMHRFFVAETESGLVGFARVSVRDGAHWLEELYVLPEWRGRGIGGRLVKAVEEYVSTRDSHVYIMVLPQDRRAMSFWIRMGYRLLNTVELAKNLKGGKEDTRRIPLLGDILEIHRWAREDYTPLEDRFLELVETFKELGGNGRELLEIFVRALEERLSKT